ncbi:MAG: tRNA pseudouridine(38-40) synthase TruA [Phycisphaerales bacterium]|nr:tRNA pseudouridine(38-40) synthase TruA [Phycisphaerales bacterium]
MPRFLLRVAYDGTDFHGWQRQEPPDVKPLRTAQGALTDAVSDLLGERISVNGASRTDAGVHARGQVAAFSSGQARVPIERLPMAINTRLPADIEVREARVVCDAFDPVRDCLSKSYSYRLRHGSAGRPPHVNGRADPFDREMTAHCHQSLDLAAMQLAASQMTGTRDYKAFAHCPEQRETTVRSVHMCAVSELSPGLLRFDVAGSGFLYHMVRIMVGTLVDVGRARLDAGSISDLIASGERKRAGQTMPPQGLCLEWIHYSGQELP